MPWGRLRSLLMSVCRRSHGWRVGVATLPSGEGGPPQRWVGIVAANGHLTFDKCAYRNHWPQEHSQVFR